MSPYPTGDYNNKECGGGGGDICFYVKNEFQHFVFVFFRKEAE